MPALRSRQRIAALLAAALALAALPAIPATAGDQIPVVAREVVTSLDRTRVVELPIAASHVALYWRGEHEAEVSIALSRDGRTFGEVEPVEHDEVGEARRDGNTYGSVTHAEGARFARVTSDRPLARLTVLAIDSTGGNRGPAFAPSIAAAAVPQPAVTSRAGWGADESLRFNEDGTEKWIPAFHPVQKLIVHHTATKNNDPDPAATVRAIYRYHAIDQGWGDIGYNFLIDESGQVYEGRYSRAYDSAEYPSGEDTDGNGVTAAHVYGYNSGTVGIALLGTLTNVDAATGARDAVERLLAWKAERHGIDPHGASLYTNPVNGTQRTFANIAGHRDLAATECPGGAFYNTFPALRDAVAARITGSGGETATVPDAPILTGSAAKGRGVQLSWSAPADGGSAITAYRVYRSTGSGAAVLVAEVSGSTTSYKDTSTARRTTYTYTVSAVNAIGEGALSNSATVTTR